jgi:hypothetical protein
MSYYSYNWKYGRDIIDRLGGPDYLKLALGAKNIRLTRYISTDVSSSWATIVFKLEPRGEYRVSLVVKFVSYKNLEVRLVETRKIGPFFLRRTDVHVKQKRKIFPCNVYVSLPDPLRDKESLSYFISCIEEVTGRCLDPFGMLS